MKQRFRLIEALVCVTAVLAAAAWAVREHVMVAILPFDDAFITYRYVENLTRGAGFAYNPSIPVWGFTSPLYLFWLSGLRAIFATADLPTLAVRTNVVFVIAAGLTTLFLVRRYTDGLKAASVAACVLLAHPSLLSVSSGGMEPGLFLALVLLALLSHTYDRPVLTGALIGLAFLARPEAVILLPLTAIAYRRNLRRLLALLIAAGIVAGAWLGFAAVYFGSIIPLPIVAKNTPLYPLPPGHALGVIFGYMGPAVVGPWSASSLTRDVIVGVIVLAATAVCIAERSLRARHAWMPGVFAILAVALYWYGNPMFFEWYWPPILGTVLITLILGGVGVWRLVAARSERTEVSAFRRYGAAVGYWAVPAWVIAMTVAAYGDNAGGHSKSIRFVHEDPTRLRILTYRHVGERLTALTGGSASIAAAEVGALGYYYTGRMIDACGLVSPEAIRFLSVPDEQRMGPAAGAISVELLRGTYPEWVVSMPIFIQNSLLKSDWFWKYYELKGTVRLPKLCFDSKYVMVFKRRPH